MVAQQIANLSSRQRLSEFDSLSLRFIVCRRGVIGSRARLKSE